jgi:hypothetical protein
LKHDLSEMASRLKAASARTRRLAMATDRRSRSAASLAAMLAASLAFGCNDAEPPPEAAAAPGPAAPEVEERRVAAPTASTLAPKPDAEGEITPPKAPTALVLRPHESWTVLETDGGNPIASYSLAPAPGDDDAARLDVTHFGPVGAGPLLPNLHRWSGLFEQPDGSRTVDRALTSERKVGELPVSEVEISGTYVGPPDARLAEPRPGWKLMAALVTSPHGPYYFRLIGPAATVDAHAAEFRDFLSRLE